VTQGGRSLPSNCFEPVRLNPMMGGITGYRRFTSGRFFLLCGDCGGGLANHVNDEVGL
jgi:hypothetical protein